MKTVSYCLAAAALVAHASAAGMSLRGSAFVPTAVPCKPETAMMGSLQNKPNHKGVVYGLPVGTAKQQKQAKIAQDAAQKALVEENRARKVAIKEAREARDAAAVAAAEEKWAAAAAGK
mmetsp:Transcript_26710/g.67393  ORF Transcript_26710/g.67393 Transcript_26710/m.67393 type:complete len:119 (+) Transcript_26710:54-410(+)|eukprot:CAMPEP_0173431668 /NCGR_PEP_ID=MMETSP1357-20121228/9737_1 /TAXON_ID=77926 /ORGANISM="Hemiselmis rufescens, Strain PCC563" /LENGTH=118 /DNA_ID=CAMNT_0014396173 /DNA_START=45 /DNA_END=401 /DNA_ORIENTATION=+